MAPSREVWSVIGGRTDLRAAQMLDVGVVGSGWEHLPSLVGVGSRDEVAARYAAAYPRSGSAGRAHYVDVIWKLVDGMHDGDLVVMQVKARKAVAVGRVVGPYEFRSELGDGLRHVRPVEWLATELPRGALDQRVMDAIGDFLTFTRVGGDDVAAGVLAALDRSR